MKIATAFLLAALTCFAESNASGPQPAERSVRILNEAIRRGTAPNTVLQARRELARIYARRGEWWGAIEQLEAAKKLAPKDPECAYQLGMAYNGLSKWAFDRMQSISPKAGRTQQILGEQYATAGENELAEKAFRNAIKAAPALEGSHLALAMLYLRMGRRVAAVAEIDQELRISPESAAARQLRQSLGGDR